MESRSRAGVVYRRAAGTRRGSPGPARRSRGLGEASSHRPRRTPRIPPDNGASRHRFPDGTAGVRRGIRSRTELQRRRRCAGGSPPIPSELVRRHWRHRRLENTRSVAASPRGDRTRDPPLEPEDSGRGPGSRGEGRAPSSINRGHRRRASNNDRAHGARPSLSGRLGPGVFQPSAGLRTPADSGSRPGGRSRRRSVRGRRAVRHPHRETMSAEARSCVGRQPGGGRAAPREHRG